MSSKSKKAKEPTRDRSALRSEKWLRHPSPPAPFPRGERGAKASIIGPRPLRERVAEGRVRGVVLGGADMQGFGGFGMSAMIDGFDVSAGTAAPCLDAEHSQTSKTDAPSVLFFTCHPSLVTCHCPSQSIHIPPLTSTVSPVM